MPTVEGIVPTGTAAAGGKKNKHTRTKKRKMTKTARKKKGRSRRKHK